MPVTTAPAPAAPDHLLRTTGQLRRWVARDLARYEVGGGVRAVSRLARLPQARWQIGLRVAELAVNAGPAWRGVSVLLRWRVQAGAVRLGYTIPLNVCGPGLKLPHWGTIVISSDAQVGADCTIHPSTCLGVHHGAAPQLGDGVYVAPGAKAYGPITVGAGATLAANSVTNRSVPPGVTVGGVPSRPLPPPSAARTSARRAAAGGSGHPVEPVDPLEHVEQVEDVEHVEHVQRQGTR